MEVDRVAGTGIPKIEKFPEAEGAPKEEAGQAEQTEQSHDTSSENVTATFSPENKSRFDAMSEGARDIASKAYEGLYKIPLANKLLGKLEIAYHQSWVDTHEAKAAELKGKTEKFDFDHKIQEDSKAALLAGIESLKSQSFPGVASLERKVQDIERKQAEIASKRDNVNSKFEARSAKVQQWVGERNRVADKFIAGYGEKLRPMEKKLEDVRTSQDEFNLRMAVVEVRHADILAKVAKNEKTKLEIEEALKKSGTSEKKAKANEAVKALEGVIAKARQDVRVEAEKLLKEKLRIDAKVAAADAKAAPQRNKRDTFIRMKSLNQTGRGPVEAGQTRGASSSAGEGSPGFAEGEATPEAKIRLRCDEYIAAWNQHIQKVYGRGATSEVIDAQDFLKASKLPASYELDTSSFKKILEAYYKLKKRPLAKLRADYKVFFAEEEKAAA